MLLSGSPSSAGQISGSVDYDLACFPPGQPFPDPHSTRESVAKIMQKPAVKISPDQEGSPKFHAHSRDSGFVIVREIELKKES
ncbi:hypothetical protein N7495_007075 [Penicillium taxi]|uniref:uncharacterized protein n=1 Tax=Penicillium taxi TaxID=168475 RepID=UPI002545212D|nr:uncharacterized protein N7495_007075 [Penicillium taxi]KAJ5895384.1 hypothetical protein N7495_007075 [Penicillium taxi]